MKAMFEDEFMKRALAFGVVDENTQSYRKTCCDLGFKVVFKDGMSETQAVKVLKSKATQRALAKF